MLVPCWAQDIKIGGRSVNARAETIHEKPSFRTPSESRRALIPVDAFDEWPETEQMWIAAWRAAPKNLDAFARPTRRSPKRRPADPHHAWTWIFRPWIEPAWHSGARMTAGRRLWPLPWDGGRRRSALGGGARQLS
jgi:hypothetical protein